MTTAHDTKRHSTSRSGTSSSKHKHSRRKQDDHSRVVSTKLNQGLSVDTSELLWTYWLHVCEGRGSAGISWRFGGRGVAQLINHQ